MPLNLSSAFNKADTVLNNLLSKYVGLKIIGLNEDDDNSPYYLLDGKILTSGFYYKAKKNPTTGEVRELFKIVPETDEINQALIDGELLELIDEQGNFVRFRFTAEQEPEPPTFEWKYLLTPNKADTKTIT